MVETSARKKQKRGTIGEEDVCSLLQRYQAGTVLSFLREVAQYPEVKINWNVLVKKTTTGIKNARELQLLWRHLAYRHPFPEERVGADAQPLDDESDLEYEVEVLPPVSAEAAMEAANCVKVLASGSSNEPGIANNSAVELDIPNGHSSKFTSENSHAASVLHSSNGPHSVTGQSEAMDALNNSRKKRKSWSGDEDLRLIEAVRKWGEGNWSTILKEDKWGRTPNQLAQRWANMKRKQGGLNAGGASSSGPLLSEAQLATRRAIDMALKDNLTAAGNGAPGTSNPASNGESPVTNIPVPSQRPPQVTNTPSKPATVGPLPKSRPPLKKAPPKPPSVGADPIQRAAVAAGARIASASDADALRKAVQSKNTSSLPPNVHFIRTGLTGTTVSMAAGTASSFPNAGQQAKDNTTKPSVPTIAVSQLTKARTMPTVLSERSNASSSIPANEFQKREEKGSREVNAPGSETKQIVGVHEKNASLPRCLAKAPLEKGQSTSCSTPGLNKQTVSLSSSQQLISKYVLDNERTDGAMKQMSGNPVPVDITDNLPATQRSCIPSVHGKQEVLTSSVVDEAEKSDKMDL